jgi:hypothetical protein
VVIQTTGLTEQHDGGELRRDEGQITAMEYSGVIATIPAINRVDTMYSIGRIAIDSSASISSLIRIAPNCAVTPAPNVAANPIPATTGATMRTLMNAARNPVNASIPKSPSDE